MLRQHPYFTIPFGSNIAEFTALIEIRYFNTAISVFQAKYYVQISVFHKSLVLLVTFS